MHDVADVVGWLVGWLVGRLYCSETAGLMKLLLGIKGLILVSANNAGGLKRTQNKPVAKGGVRAVGRPPPPGAGAKRSTFSPTVRALTS